MMSHGPAPVPNVTPRQSTAHPAIRAAGAPAATFSSLTQAIRAGFQIYDRTDHGYLVRCKTAAGWAYAIVELSDKNDQIADTA